MDRAEARPGILRARLPAFMMASLGALNIAVWLAAILTFRHAPALLGTCVIAYGFGLRHALDADHIAAIDNVTRKLLQQGRPPFGAGLFFSLGHSTIVILASAAIAFSGGRFKLLLGSLQSVGGVLGTTVSAAFLLCIAAANFAVFLATLRAYRAQAPRRASGASGAEVPTASLAAGQAWGAPGGILARCLRPAFRLISRSWHMYPLGVLFGLGFDTATEIGLLGISAAEVSRGLSLWSIMVFPALFTAGMSLVDTGEGLMMTGAYAWALDKPRRKLGYNLTITLISVIAAFGIGTLEVLSLIQDQVQPGGVLWSVVDAAGRHFGSIGAGLVAMFAVFWAVSAWRDRAAA